MAGTRIAEEKINRIALEYCNNGYNKSKALIAVGYSERYATTTGLKVYDNARVKEAIAKIEQKRADISDVTLREVIDNARYLVSKGKENDDMVAIKAGNDQLGRTIAAFTDNLQTNKLDVSKPSQEDLEKLEDITKTYKLKLSTG